MIMDQILQLYRARYPVVLLVSHEEERILSGLRGLVSKEGCALYRWRSTEGLTGPGGAVDGSEALAAALKRLGAVEEAALFVLHDVDAGLEDALAVRQLRDLAQQVGARGQMVVLTGCASRVPESLEKDITILDMPLPDREEVGKLLASLIKVEGIDLPPERFWRFVDGSLGLTEREIQRLLARIAISGAGFSEEDLRTLVQEKRQAIRRSRFLEFWDSGGRVEDVGGMDALKAWLQQRARGFSEEARNFGLSQPKGLFLLGVQGCGKSLMAKAVADMWKLPLLRLDVAAVFQGIGREDESLRQTVRVAERLAPVVLWIDELEKGFMSMAETGGGQAFSSFLTWMQEKTAPVFVVATANEVRALPPELLRKGRFDEIFFVDLPDVHERLQILEIHLRLRKRDPHAYDLTVIAEETERFSGAELEEVVVSGLFNAFSEHRELTFEDLLDAGRDTVPLAVTMDDRIKSIREWARPRARRASTDRRRIDFFEDWEVVQ
jgi:SpoVK/Ycf46/Vps4 family AAA+-type ATPase